MYNSARARVNRYIKSIRGRILLSTLLLTMIFSIILAGICYYVVSTTLEKNLVNTSETKLSFLSSSITSNIDNVIGFVQSCQRSSTVKKYAMNSDEKRNSSRVAALDYITDAYYSNSALRSQLIRFAVVSNSSEDMVQIVETNYSTTATNSTRIKELDYFNRLSDTDTRKAQMINSIEADPFLQKEVPMIPIVCAIEHPYRDEIIGYGYAEMSPSVVIEPIENYLLEKSNLLYITIGEKNYKYKDGNLILSEDIFDTVKDISDEALDERTILYVVSGRNGRGSMIMVRKPLEIPGMYVTEFLDGATLSITIRNTFLTIVVLILALALAIFFILSRYLSRTVNRPVKMLQERMDRIAEGDFSRDENTEWNHELGQIGKDINDLSENVLSLMNQRIDDERQKKDYEYKMLQSQINPHFLYNTLNSIKWMATIQNAPGIAEMTTALSRLLKDISKGTTNTVSIEHELSLIKDYFTIQQYRYGGTISLEIVTDDEELLRGTILKFTMQPIVENAIFHGIEPKGTAGKITIHSYFMEREDKNQGNDFDADGGRDIVIEITDDGVGMEPEMCESILSSDTQTKSAFFKEIGVSSVHKRLQYEFGKEYGLSIRSVPGEYTTIVIKMPFVETEI